jgi:signal transduction histidine kinase
MPQGGKLRVESANVSVGATSSEVERGVLAGDYVRIKVSDTGQGVEPEVIDRVFEPFLRPRKWARGAA